VPATPPDTGSDDVLGGSGIDCFGCLTDSAHHWLCLSLYETGWPAVSSSSQSYCTLNLTCATGGHRISSVSCYRLRMVQHARWLSCGIEIMRVFSPEKVFPRYHTSIRADNYRSAIDDILAYLFIGVDITSETQVRLPILYESSSSIKCLVVTHGCVRPMTNLRALSLHEISETE
jgi:hypothetical protein